MLGLLVSLFLAGTLSAQSYRVASVNGDAHCLRAGQWDALTPRETLSAADIVRIGKHSVLSVIDRDGNRLYALKEQEEAPLAEIIEAQRRSALGRFATNFLRALTRAQDCYALDPHKLQLDPGQAKSILALGVPAGLQNAIFAIANLFIQAGVNSFDSLMVKGNSAAANADGLIYDCMAAFYMACASFMSQNYGAGRPDRVKKSYFISLGYSFGVGFVLGAALFFCGPAFLALFTTEAAVIDAGMKRVAVMAFAYCVSAFMDCTIAASRGLGKTVVPTVIVVLGSCVFRVIWVYTIFAHFHTIPALYLLYPCSWILTALAEIAYFASCYKRAMAIFRKPAAA